MGKLKGEVSKEQIQEWKKKYGDVYKFSNDSGVCYLRRVDRTTMAFAQISSAGNPIRFNEIILENCWLGGDERFKTDDAFFLGISAKLDEIIEMRTTELEKL